MNNNDVTWDNYDNSSKHDNDNKSNSNKNNSNKNTNNNKRITMKIM